MSNTNATHLICFWIVDFGQMLLRITNNEIFIALVAQINMVQLAHQ